MADSDWEIDKGQHNISPQAESDWELPNQESSLLSSILKAPFRVGGDIFNAGLNLAKRIPGYLEKAPSEISGLPKTLYEHPGHLAKQLGAGLTELGHETLNLPHSLGQYASKRLELLPENIANKIPFQKDISQDISGLFGEPQYPGEAMMRGALRNLPAITGAKEALTYPMKLTNKAIAKDLVKTEKEIKKEYSGPKGKYENLFNEATEAGAMPHVNIDSKQINFDALSKGTAQHKMESLNKLKEGKIDLRDAQNALSELGFIERSLKNKGEATLLPFESKKLLAAQRAKNYIENNMFKDRQGNVMPRYLNRHKKIQEGYATEYIPYAVTEALQDYKGGKASAKELVEAISKRPFPVHLRKKHRVGQKEMVQKGIKWGGIGVPTSALIYDYLTRNR